MIEPIRMTDAERKLARQAITSHPDWTHVRRALGIDSSALGTSNCNDAADILNLDLARIILGSNLGTTMSIVHGREAASATIAQFNAVKAHLPARDRSFGEAMIATIVNKFDGGMSERQKAQLERLTQIGKAAAGDNGQQSFDDQLRAAAAAREAEERAIEAAEKAKAQRAAAKEANTSATKSEAATIAIETPAVAAAADPAGAAIAALVLPHITAGVAASVQRMVSAALENVSTVRLEIPRHDGTTYTTSGHVHPKFATLLRACNARQANGRVPGIWITGPASSGKTHAAEAAAEALGLPFYTQGACSMSHELVGFISANGTYMRTPFRDAFEHGGLCLLDELDSYDASATLAVNAALANGVCAFPDGMIKRHVDCIVIGAANTNGQGATATYVGRNRLDAAFLSRFPIKIEWPLDPALEQATSGNPAFAKRVQAARVRAEAAGVKHQIDARHSAAGAALIAAGFSMDEAAELTYLAGLSPAQIKMVEGR